MASAQTYFLQSDGARAPYPFDPYAGIEPMTEISSGVYLIQDNANDYATMQSFNRSAGRMMSMDVPNPGEGGGGTNGGFYSDSFNFSFDTNSLWLEITNISNGAVFANLHNATDYVYEIWSKTNLLQPSWDIAAEVFPADINCQPFNLQPSSFNPQLFLWARDWTGITSNGNTVPEWWFWKYFHTLDDLLDTNLDSQGNTLGYDYTHHIDPDVIDFFIRVANNYVNTDYPALQLNIESGVPRYYAILANDTNTPDAVWQLYTSSNIVATLGADGNYNVFIGLRGWPDEATVTWQSVSLVKDTIAPLMTLTSPTTETISNSPVSLEGYANEALSELIFDVSNAAGIFTNQQGFLSGQFYDTNLLTVTTNWFQCVVDLSNGTNLITLYGTDWAGNTTSASFTLNYFNTNSPALAVVWPQPDAAISGSNFTMQAQVDSTAIKIAVSIADSSGDTNVVQGLIEKNGLAWIQNLPLNNGTNNVTVTATGANGSMSATNFNLVKNDVGLVVYPLDGYQLNQSSVSVYGEIGDTNLCVWVNGIQAYYVDDYGDWEADDVPVSAVGTAALNVQVYIGDPVLVASQNFYQPQPVTVGMMSYSGHHDLSLWGNNTETVNWSYLTGGNMTDSYFPGTFLEISSNIDGVAYADLGANFSDSIFPFVMPWEYASLTAYQWYGDEIYPFGNYTQTRVMVEPSGQSRAGTTNLYLVYANACEFSSYKVAYGFYDDYGAPYSLIMMGMRGAIGGWHGYFGDEPLPPEWLQINGKTLINSGIAADRGAMWGETIVAAPAGVNWDVTPTAMQVHDNWDYTFDVQAVDVTPFMLADLNRNGNVDSLTTSNNPFRFWINDSKESGDIASGADSQIPGSGSPNYALNQINGRSDLVNYFPVALSLSNALQFLPLTNGWEFHLSQADGAVKFVYTSQDPDNAFDYLTNAAATDGYGVDGTEPPQSADTIPVTSSGTVLDTNWLAMVQDDDWSYGTILVEGCAATSKPLNLEIWKNGQKLGSVPLYLSISNVEQMYRWVNLRGAIGAPQTRATDVSEPANNPDSLSNGKNFVFVHGYNVDESQARGWNAEFFKRLYWSGSKAKFYAVDWDGSQSDGDWVPGVTANYQTNVVTAFLTAPALATFINGLSGETVLAGHSLGNMVCLSAISDCGALPSKYFMIDAAVPMEAIDGSLPIDNDMVYADSSGNWLIYSNWLWASKWFSLWPTNDARSTLTWGNRLANLGNVDVYNFYSSGENVLRDYPDTPPASLFTLFGSQLVQYIEGQSGTYVWAWQEKDKGRMSGNSILSSNHGGWGFNFYYSNYSVEQANALSFSRLQTNAFFNMSVDSDLFTINSSGSAYAAANRNRILADAIPALTLPIGANFASVVGTTHNFDMQANFENSWPSSRGTQLVGSPAAGEWWHSDLCNVAYPFTYKLFNQLVTSGNLK